MEALETPMAASIAAARASLNLALTANPLDPDLHMAMEHLDAAKAAEAATPALPQWPTALPTPASITLTWPEGTLLQPMVTVVMPNTASVQVLRESLPGDTETYDRVLDEGSVLWREYTRGPNGATWAGDIDPVLTQILTAAQAAAAR